MVRKSNYIIAIIISLGIFFRFHQLNYEDFWIDEIFSFWIADPNISFFETFERHNNIEQIPILFNLILKFFYSFFGYEIKSGRYLVVLFGCLSIIYSYILSLEFKDKDFRFLFIFLISFNVFLIKYSQELRPYTLIVLLFVLSLLYFFRCIKNQDKFSNFFLFTFFITLLIFVHPFNLILYFSIIFFILFNLIFKKYTFKKLNWSLFLSLIFCSIYYLIYFKNLNELTSWIPDLEPKFFTNFFFSKFFGSRSLGIFHLATLIFLIFKFKKKLINSNKFLLLSAVIFFTYLIPILFSFIFKNVLLDRYIIFVIIPVLLIITSFIYFLENKFLRNSLISLFFLLTIINFSTENNFKHFYKNINKTKPDFNSALSKINDSKVKNLLIKKTETNIYDKIEFYNLIDNAINTYIKMYIENNNYNLRIIDQLKLKNFKNEHIWILCYTDLDLTNCKIPINNNKFTVQESLNFSKLNLKKLVINIEYEN